VLDAGVVEDGHGDVLDAHEDAGPLAGPREGRARGRHYEQRHAHTSLADEPLPPLRPPVAALAQSVPMQSQES
jgi:hypothetical protein